MVRVVAAGAGGLISGLLQKAVEVHQPAARVCLVPFCDLFPKPCGQLYVSLLAQDAVKRAGIDMAKPFVLDYDRKRGYWRFTQLEADCR